VRLRDLASEDRSVLWNRSMLATRSLYSDSTESATSPPALTDFPCEYAPQQGVHLYHFPLSPCSQKVRQILVEKRVAWQSHVILLPAYEQYDPAYVRINPRCVVPALVCDGKVTTDSENVLRYVDRKWDGPRRVIAWRNPLTNVVWPMLVRRAKALFS